NCSKASPKDEDGMETVTSACWAKETAGTNVADKARASASFKAGAAKGKRAARPAGAHKREEQRVTEVFLTDRGPVDVRMSIPLAKGWEQAARGVRKTCLHRYNGRRVENPE